MYLFFEKKEVLGLILNFLLLFDAGDAPWKEIP